MRHAHAGLKTPEYYVPGLPAEYVAQRYGIPFADIAKLGSAEAIKPSHRVPDHRQEFLTPRIVIESPIVSLLRMPTLS